MLTEEAKEYLKNLNCPMTLETYEKFQEDNRVFISTLQNHDGSIISEPVFDRNGKLLYINMTMDNIK